MTSPTSATSAQSAPTSATSARSAPRVARTVSDLRALLGPHTTQSIGFIPTMGALHDGHLELVRHSRVENDITVVSIFVNPSQFNNLDDLARYPRDEARDLALLADHSVDVVFAPTHDVMYPPDFSTWVSVEELSDVLEGTFRPGHFRGVATVVTLLLRMVRPTRAYFGEKDWQQLLVVRRLARDLHLDVEIVGVPTVRESDGLAMSSRNARLDDEARAGARVISETLAAVQAAYAAGERDVASLEMLMYQRLAQEPTLTPEYAAIVHAETLRAPASEHEPLRALIAAHIGGVRLIDNAPVA